MKYVTKKTKLKPWTTLSTQTIHENRWWKVRHDKFSLPDGTIGDYYILDSEASVLIVPVKGGRIILEKQFRYPTKKWSIELPGGGVKRGSSPLKTAKEELHEELGYEGKFTKIGTFEPFNGVSQEVCSVYIAKNLKFIGDKKENTESIKAFDVSIKEAYEMIENGKIKDGMTIAALTLARKHIITK